MWEVIYKAGGFFYRFRRTRPLAWRIAKLYARNEAGDEVFERLKEWGLSRESLERAQVLYEHLFRRALAQYTGRYFVK